MRLIRRNRLLMPANDSSNRAMSSWTESSISSSLLSTVCPLSSSGSMLSSSGSSASSSLMSSSWMSMASACRSEVRALAMVCVAVDVVLGGARIFCAVGMVGDARRVVSGSNRKRYDVACGDDKHTPGESAMHVRRDPAFTFTLRKQTDAHPDRLFVPSCF
jgi:hypothetical protein